MSDFHTFAIVTARKQHRCEQCGSPIETGTQHRKCAQVWEGHFHSYREHVECFDAWNRLNFDLRGLSHCEGAMFLCEDEHDPDDRPWMREHYPEVAERLGWKDDVMKTATTKAGRAVLRAVTELVAAAGGKCWIENSAGRGHQKIVIEVNGKRGSTPLSGTPRLIDQAIKHKLADVRKILKLLSEPVHDH